MTAEEFRKALYYAVREGFNADVQERKGGALFPYIDTEHDALIRQGITYFESTTEKDLPPMCGVEIEGLAMAANRRESALHGN